MKFSRARRHRFTRLPFSGRRVALVDALAGSGPLFHVTPATTDIDMAALVRRVRAPGDGVIAKPLDGTHLPDKRVMFKIKHQRTADCVVAGYRLHKSGDDAVGSLWLGLPGGTRARTCRSYRCASTTSSRALAVPDPSVELLPAGMASGER